MNVVMLPTVSSTAALSLLSEIADNFFLIILRFADSGRDDSDVIMSCQFPVGAVNLGCVPVSCVVYKGLEIVRYQHNLRAAELPEHIHVDMAPVFYIHPQTGFCISIHAKGQYIKEQINRNYENILLRTQSDSNLIIFILHYNLYMKSSVALVSNLISLSDIVFPGVNELFTSPKRADGHQKWIDFFTTFRHCECISWVSEEVFIERYQKWCKRKGYRFSASNASDIYIDSLGHIVTLPKNNTTKLLVQTAAKELTAMNEQIAVVRNEMIRLAKELPEYETVHAMFGVGEITAAQLMTEIGNIRNYPRRSSLVGFAGVDPEVNQSGNMNSKSNPSTKRYSPHLRKTLFQII